MVRLSRERELIGARCRDRFGIARNYGDIREYMDDYPHGYWVRREWVAGRLPKPAAKQARAQRLGRCGASATFRRSLEGKSVAPNLTTALNNVYSSCIAQRERLAKLAFE